MRARPAVPAAALFGVAPCAAPSVWQRPGATAEQVARDVADCRQTALPCTKISPTAGWTSRVRTGRDEQAACLEARGYRRVPTSTDPAS